MALWSAAQPFLPPDRCRVALAITQSAAMQMPSVTWLSQSATFQMPSATFLRLKCRFSDAWQPLPCPQCLSPFYRHLFDVSIQPLSIRKKSVLLPSVCVFFCHVHYIYGLYMPWLSEKICTFAHIYTPLPLITCGNGNGKAGVSHAVAAYTHRSLPARIHTTQCNIHTKNTLQSCKRSSFP